MLGRAVRRRCCPGLAIMSSRPILLCALSSDGGRLEVVLHTYFSISGRLWFMVDIPGFGRHTCSLEHLQACLGVFFKNANLLL